ncbi:MAG: diguanylate cyclase [Candidatus Zixiibacteriota bacterium]
MAEKTWAEMVGVAITVTDAQGTITEMNPASIATFASYGGDKLIGTDVLACHPEPSKSQLAAMYKDNQPNHYTIQKNGKKKIIHQLPLFDNGVFHGYVEISIPIPDDLPHFDRD